MSEITYYIKKKIGREVHSFSVTGKNFHEAVMAAEKLSFGDVPRCGICGNDDLVLGAHVTEEGHNYTHIRCKKCRATLNFGQQKKDNTVYYVRIVDGINAQGQAVKVHDWKPYVPKPVN